MKNDRKDLFISVLVFTIFAPVLGFLLWIDYQRAWGNIPIGHQLSEVEYQYLQKIMKEDAEIAKEDESP